MYMSAIKAMLGVRRSTSNLVGLLEAGFPTIVNRIQMAQKRLLRTLINERQGMVDDPFYFVWKLCEANKTNGYRYLQSILNKDINPTEDIKSLIMSKTGSKFITYRELINPSLVSPKLYTDSELNILDHERVHYTRLRTSSHNLAIEMGRWSRIPRDERWCKCGSSVQSEQHVLLECPLTRHLRDESVGVLSFTSLNDLFNSDSSCMIKYVSKCLKIFENI